MALFVTVPISTEVIESNADCALSGAYGNGVLVITIDSRGQNVHQRLGLGSKTRLHWGAEHWFEVQESSGLTWPIPAVQGRKANESRRKAALDRDCRGR